MEGLMHAMNIKGLSDEEFRLLKTVKAEMRARSWKDVLVGMAEYCLAHKPPASDYTKPMKPIDTLNRMKEHVHCEYCRLIAFSGTGAAVFRCQKDDNLIGNAACTAEDSRTCSLLQGNKV